MNWLTKGILKAPWIAIILILGITIFFGMKIPELQKDNELTTFLPEEDPAKQFYNTSTETFGSEIIAVIGIFTDEGGPYKDVFDPSILTLVRDLSDELETLDPPIKAEYNTRELKKQSDGSEIWEIVKTEITDVDPDEVISLSTLSHVASRVQKSEFPDEEDEVIIEVIDVLPEPPGTREDRFKILSDTSKSYRDLPEDLLYSKEITSEARKILDSWEMYKNNIVSSDLRSTAIYVTIPRGATIDFEEKLQERIETLLAKYEHPDDGLHFHVSGLPMVAVLLGQYMNKDLITLVPICFGVIFLILIISFRRFNGVFLPFVTVSLAVIWTMGLMSWLGVAMSVITSGLPVLLVAVGSAYTIHVVHHFYEQRSLGVKKRDAILSTMTKIGAAVMMAGLTTVGGFGSLVASKVIPIKEYGIFSAFGAFAALAISFILVPALLSVQRFKKEQKPAQSKQDELAFAEKSILGRLLRRIAGFVSARPVTIAVVSAIILGGFIYASTKIIVTSNMVKFFRYDSPIRVSDRALNGLLGGTTTFSVVVDGKKDAEFDKPDALRKVDAFADAVRAAFPMQITKSMAVSDYVKKINQTIGKEKESEYRIPDSEAAVMEAYLLYESKPEVLEGVLDFDHRQTRVLFRSSEGATGFMTELKPVIEAAAKKHLPNYDTKITGELFLRWVTDQEITEGQKISIVLSIAAVFILLIIIFRSVKLALICLSPIILSIMGNFALMAWLGIPLDVGTALIASTAVGIGIDYAIHYVNRYRIERRAVPDISEAIRRTHVTSGKAIVFNCLAVALGFLVLVGSQFLPLVRMGLLSAAVMFLSALTTLTILPALLLIIRPYSDESAEPGDSSENETDQTNKEIAQ